MGDPQQRLQPSTLLVTYSGTYGFRQLPLSSWQPSEQGLIFHLANVPQAPYTERIGYSLSLVTPSLPLFPKNVSH